MALPRNQREVVALEKFQALVEDVDEDRKDKGTLMRFLRARNLDLSNAETMFRTHVAWRTCNIYEPALEEGWKPPKELMNKFEVALSGFDNDGRPVFFIRFHNWLPSSPMFNVFEQLDMMLLAYSTFLALYRDLMMKCKSQQLVAILDNEGIGFSSIFHEVQFWKGIQTLIDIWSIYEANFPEVLHKAFFVNTHRAFLWGFNLMKPFASKHTLEKIEIFGNDPEKYVSAMKNLLPLDAIPEQFGGTAKLKSVYDVSYDGILENVKRSEKISED